MFLTSGPCVILPNRNNTLVGLPDIRHTRSTINYRPNIPFYLRSNILGGPLGGARGAVS